MINNPQRHNLVQVYHAITELKKNSTYAGYIIYLVPGYVGVLDVPCIPAGRVSVGTAVGRDASIFF